MAKTTTQYTCQVCATTFSRWMGKCEQCGAWNSLVEEAAPVSSGTGKAKAAAALTPKRLGEVQTAKLPRFSTGVGEVDQVLGGGVVPGAAWVSTPMPR